MTLSFDEFFERYLNFALYFFDFILHSIFSENIVSTKFNRITENMITIYTTKKSARCLQKVP